ncbi:GNAT family N-acetyltransferase [Eubacteriales bacterium OttesenSCG-928-N14]|nr:GNAT family N-acetyltransferase [Eubacteriales bacterium OttesenSCG-928-N14]
MMKELETERLLLRAYQAQDVDDFYEYMKLEETARYEDFMPLSYDACVNAIAQRMEQCNNYAVVHKSTGKVIGDVGFAGGAFETFSISFDFNPAYGKQGYATEAVDAVVAHIFTTCTGRRIIAECNDDNENSIHLLQRLGFRKEGHMLEDVSFKQDADGKPIYVNSYLFALLSREYHAR